MNEPRYSGPNRSGICVCGHPWDEHHLGIVMNNEYYDATHEAYVPEECEHYGFNEMGGRMPMPDGRWVDHCQSYRDSLEVK
jgi:hypothetical protein